MMGVLLQGFFKLPPNQAVPSPADGDVSIPWWWDHLASQAHELRRAGYTAVWLPPVLKTSDGDKPGSDGYGPFDDYDIGSKNQKGSQPTRFGTREQLQRMVAVMRANGLDVYLDVVEHQRVGDTTPFVFRYPGARGTADAGRFPKNPSNFVPQVPRDPALGGPASDDFPFGRELAPINAKPPHYVFDNLISAADWLTRALDAQGYRVDDVKGLSTEFLLPFLNSKAMKGKFAVGEFFDGNRTLVNGWIFNPTGMQGRPSAFDFPLKFVLGAMCNSPGGFNMADLDHVGLAGISPLHAVTFVENHDTDLSASQRIIINKMLGYAYILTSEGYPCVYYRDYSTDKDCFGLKPLIDNLIWIHEMLASGPTEQRWKDFNVFAFERLGGPHLLVGLNNDPNNPRTVNVATGFGSSVALHDYTGNSPDVVTDGNGSVTITVPKNQNGRSYVCYSRHGFEGAAFAVVSRPVAQDFEGAEDLDIPAATSGNTIDVGRVWCRAGSPLSLVLRPDVTDWTPATSITLDVLAPGGSVLATSVFKLSTPAGTALNTTSMRAGFHTLRLTLAGAPAARPNVPFMLSAAYTADPLFEPD
jgi:alpha-amylase